MGGQGHGLQLNRSESEVVIKGTDGQIVKVTNNGLDVNIQDQTTDLVDLYLTREIDTITLTQNTNIDDKQITFDSATVPVVGNVVCLKEVTAFYQGFILSVTPNGGVNYTVTLDSPLDYAFTTAGGCSINEHNLATANGSVTPQIFKVSPKGLQAGTKWDIVRLMFFIAGSSAMDDGLFGSETALTNGLVVRKKDVVYKNIFNIKTNGEFAQRAYDIRYATQLRPPSGTLYTITSRRTFGGQSKNGVVVRLSADDLDEFQAIVQDNLTAGKNEDIHVIAQGHVVE